MMDCPVVASGEAMAHTSTYRISVETLENGYSVEVPDMAAIAKRHADEKKKEIAVTFDLFRGLDEEVRCEVSQGSFEARASES
jgi:hypothetical protein